MVDLSDYIEVADRIAAFRERFPDGSLQAQVLRYPEEGFPFLVVEARAFRSPEDPRPGVGLAWEPFPGRTPYTKDSELMNAETSAWGRALVACGAADTKRGVASREEVSKASAGGPPSDGMQAGAEESSSESHTAPRGGSTKPASAFPVDPLVCAANDHKTNRGFPKWTDGDLCALCGTPKITALEGTMADLK